MLTPIYKVPAVVPPALASQINVHSSVFWLSATCKPSRWNIQNERHLSLNTNVPPRRPPFSCISHGVRLQNSGYHVPSLTPPIFLPYRGWRIRGNQLWHIGPSQTVESLLPATHGDISIPLGSNTAHAESPNKPLQTFSWSCFSVSSAFLFAPPGGSQWHALSKFSYHLGHIRAFNFHNTLHQPAIRKDIHSFSPQDKDHVYKPRRDTDHMLPFVIDSHSYISAELPGKQLPQIAFSAGYALTKVQWILLSVPCLICNFLQTTKAWSSGGTLDKFACKSYDAIRYSFALIGTFLASQNISNTEY